MSPHVYIILPSMMNYTNFTNPKLNLKPVFQSSGDSCTVAGLDAVYLRQEMIFRYLTRAARARNIYRGVGEGRPLF